MCEILFGIIMNNNYDDSRLLIFFILFGKWYINKRKSNQNPIYFLEYLFLIKDKVRTMIHRPSMEGMGVEPCLEALDDLL